ncbi:MAG TPA: hypothetical protein PK646_01260 [Bacillota bacterium]|nr:hypothetical protein [Bacillota bacterium]
MRKPEGASGEDARLARIRSPRIKRETHEKAEKKEVMALLERQADREGPPARRLSPPVAGVLLRSARSRHLDPEEVRKRRKSLKYKSFREAVQGCRELHPLPVELIESQLPADSSRLLGQLKEIRTLAELKTFADSLSYRDLSLLFTSLSILKRREETDQVQNLIRLRACHYLYLCGWLTLQYTYPRSSVSKALSDLCMILEDVRFVRESERRTHRRVSPLPGIPLGPWRIIWSRVPLISGIALPNSRYFISDIADEIYDTKADLNAFFHEYAIYPGLPLAEAITARYREMVSGVAANPLLSQDFFDRFRKSSDE